MYDVIAENDYLIQHMIENQIKPAFKNCSVHVSNMCGDINIDIGLINNVLHTNGHTATPDPLKLSLLIKVYKDKYGTTMYMFSVDTYQLILKDGEMFYGLLCNMSDTGYVGLLRSVYNWISAVKINVYNHKDKLLIRNDIKHLYI